MSSILVLLSFSVHILACHHLRQASILTALNPYINMNYASMGDIPSFVASQNFDTAQELQQKTSGGPPSRLWISGSSRFNGEAVIKLARIMETIAPLKSSIL